MIPISKLEIHNEWKPFLVAIFPTKLTKAMQFFLLILLLFFATEKKKQTDSKRFNEEIVDFFSILMTIYGRVQSAVCILILCSSFSSNNFSNSKHPMNLSLFESNLIPSLSGFHFFYFIQRIFNCYVEWTVSIEVHLIVLRYFMLHIIKSKFMF